MKCVGKKTNQEKCKANAETGFLTCPRHRDQEPAVSKTWSAPTVSQNSAVTFVSSYHEHKIVLKGRQKILNEQREVIGTPGIYAKFRDHQFTTSDSEIIDALRKHPLYGTAELQEV